MKDFFEKGCKYADPIPFIIWGVCSALVSQIPFLTVYVEQNATILNLVAGAVITSLCTFGLIIYLWLYDEPNKSANCRRVAWIGKQFSDAALGSAGFVCSLDFFVLGNIERGAIILIMSLLFVLLINHILLGVFDENFGSRKWVKSVDIRSNTDIDGNKSETFRYLEKNMMGA
ncbi:TPA: hypothetical protein NKS49_004647 [Vibrio parahaemolyticus]|nr:hypothetical protein [Vibrio parahaemolyticus]